MWEHERTKKKETKKVKGVSQSFFNLSGLIETRDLASHLAKAFGISVTQSLANHPLTVGKRRFSHDFRSCGGLSGLGDKRETNWMESHDD